MARKNILVVEDEEDILELVTYNLTREGYHAEGVLSAEEALAALKRNVPDLIVPGIMPPAQERSQDRAPAAGDAHRQG